MARTTSTPRTTQTTVPVQDRTPLLVRLDQPHPVELVGGKGANLADLIAAGHPVPTAVCLTTHNLVEMLDALLDTDVPAERRTQMLEAPLPIAVRSALDEALLILGDGPIAVRSSAVEEDSALRSFAGQFHTSLGAVGHDGVADAVRRTWASLWSDAAVAYRRVACPGGTRARMAVVLQRCLDSVVSGVMFTTDPTGEHPSHLIIDACWGLGEGIVSGRLPADHFVVDRDTGAGLSTVVGNKIRQFTIEDGAMVLRRVPAEQREIPCLTDQQVGELATRGMQLRATCDAEQDVEWAIDASGAIQLLQTRPVTTVPVAETETTPYIVPVSADILRDTVWSRMDIGEIFTGMLTPLGLSFAKYYQMNVHSDCGRSTGLLDVGEHDGRKSLSMGYLAGHVYLNVSFTAHLMSQTPPMRDLALFTERFLSEDVRLEDLTNPFGTYDGFRRLARSVPFWMRMQLNEVRDARRRTVSMTQTRLREYDRARALDLTTLDRATLDAELRRRLGYFHDMNVGYMPYYINAMTFYTLFADLSHAWLGDSGDVLTASVKTNMSNLRTLDAVREIADLADLVRSDPGLVDIVDRATPDQVAAALCEDPAGLRFWREHIEPFLRRHGTRGREEMELTYPRWVDEPAYVMQMIKRYTRADARDLAAVRASDTTSDELLAGVPRMKRLTLARVMKLYVACSELREIARMAMVTSSWLVRQVVYEVGRRALAGGAIRSLDEVAYLEFGDIQAYLAGDMSEVVAFSRATIDRNRAVHDQRLRLPDPPLTIVGQYQRRPRELAAHADTLAGLGTSPGQVEGRARVVRDLVWQADEFEVGEILVTSFTDASWTPLLALAGGIVTDVGSMLSHSSIVSREFGVPAVVNTSDATSRIHTGDRIRVDGTTGTVEILR